MQADESVYLHPGRARPGPAAMVVGEDDFPDVVLEVDHTTDVHRGKLALYESWGFPEVWVEVPDAPSPSRPHRRRPGLTIHLLEIHVALNEPAPSARTSAVVERVEAALGAREGTGPDDDPLLRSQRRHPPHHGGLDRRHELLYTGDMTLLDRISLDPMIRSGRPCIRGTRISVGDVLGYLVGGMSEEQLLNDFPQITVDDIRACLAYAAEREQRTTGIPAA